MFERGKLLYEGKAKRLYDVINDPDVLWLEFKDSLTAFNAQKKGDFTGKGLVNSQIASLIFKHLQQKGISSHWIQDVGPANTVVMRLEMIPLEVVVRNRIAGSLAKKFGKTEGEVLPGPLVEFYLKDDALEDPFISDDQIAALGIVKDSKVLGKLKNLALKVNTELKALFDSVQLDLVDFKIEVGFDRSKNVLLADEITPDSCRLWDQTTGEKMDKDRFRRDLGRVKESYEEVLARLQKKIQK